MDKVLNTLMKFRGVVIVVFVVATIISACASLMVKVNYNLMDYLPDSAPSTKALDIMNEQYTKGAPNARVMLRDVEIPDVLVYKEKIEKCDGVLEVTWLDDAVNIYEPIEFMDPDTVADYYVDGNALLTVTMDEDKREVAFTQIREICGDKGVYAGSAVETVYSQELTAQEISKILVFVLFLILVILLVTTDSYFEPVVLLITIGVAIMLNRGTNLLLGQISFVTNAAGTVLQLAVSMDYSIFLLHRFAECRQEFPNDVNKAMSEAVKLSVGSVLSSGLTTVTGFAALILMKFKIGPDMGIVMAKSIVFSLLSVLLFTPALTLYTYKLIDKTTHKPIIPPFGWLGKFVIKNRVYALIVFFVLLVPCILAQSSNKFTYGSSGIYGEGTMVGDGIAEIEGIFGKQNLMVLMVPKDELSQEKKVAEELKAYPTISSVVTYSETVGVQIPTEFVPKDQVSDLISQDYSRFVIYVDTAVEGDTAFKTADDVRAIAERYYPGTYQLLGNTVNSYDLKDVVISDNRKVNIATFLCIAVILLFNFKSISIPFILLAVIEASVWMNLSFPYFEDERLFYLGYLIISSIQLGATVDYAILFADRYKENRETLLKTPAARKTVEDTVLSVLTSGTILTIAGFMLGFMSSNGLISQLGVLVGRGAIISMVLVICVLPSIMIVLDEFIQVTTLGLNFLNTTHEKTVFRKIFGRSDIKKRYQLLKKREIRRIKARHKRIRVVHDKIKSAELERIRARHERIKDIHKRIRGGK